MPTAKKPAAKKAAKKVTAAKTEIKLHDNDTGSTAVQIANLSRKIDTLSAHLLENNKDKHSRRGLLQMVANRRKLIKYLVRTDRAAYNKLAENLGLKAA